VPPAKGMILNGYNVMAYNGSKWIMIFHQKHPEGGFFTDDECLKSLRKKRFSVIGSINESFKINSRYHFLLEYPALGDKIEWEQTKEITHSEPVDAFVYNATFNGFNGLGLSYDRKYACFDGSPGDCGYTQFWYTVGAKYHYPEGGPIPGPVYQNKAIVVNEVKLWIKFDDVFVFEYLPIIAPKCTVNYKRTLSFSFSFAMFLMIRI
jgi:hypothetical protein